MLVKRFQVFVNLFLLIDLFGSLVVLLLNGLMAVFLEILVSTHLD